MRDKPLITVGVASYNNGKYISQTLDSIKCQNYKNIELIIVDDHSIDNSIEIIERWIQNTGYFVKFIKNEENRGITFVSNLLLKTSSPESKYFALIGSDDIMDPYRISKQVEAIESQDHNIAFIFSDMVMIDEKSNKIAESYLESINETYLTISDFKGLDKNKKVASLIKKNIFPAPAVLYRKEALIAVNGWDEELYFEDWDMNLRLINKDYDFIHLNEKLIGYRVLATSLGRKPSPAYKESYLKLISKYKNINSEIDAIIKEKIINLAEVIYEENGKEAFKWLYKKLLLKPSFKVLLLTTFSLLGIKKATLKKTRRNISFNNK